MKLLSYCYEGKETVGILQEQKQLVVSAKELGFSETTMNDWIAALGKADMTALENKVSASKEGIPLANVEKLAPIPHPKQDMICLGINYMAHAEESARYKKEAFGGERPYPIYFSKRINKAVADGQAIDGHFDIVDSLDYEVELAVVIGKDTKNISKEEAFDAVLGYTIINDVSARNLQTAHKQWYFGKSLDDFTPMGPWIVTKDEVGTPPALQIISRVNGEVRQNSTTDLLIFDIPYVISELSQGMTLQAGTIIAMGTPAGVGMGFVPPNFLQKGDIVACEIEGIGTISNPVK